MKRPVMLFLFFFLFLGSAVSHAFLPGLLDERFSARPYDKIIINGEVFATTEVTGLPENSVLIKMIRHCDKPAGCELSHFDPFYYWVERRDARGKLIWQASPLEFSTYSYQYSNDGSNLPDHIGTEIIWPELSDRYWTSRLMSCDPAEKTDCYKLQSLPINMTLTVSRDEKGRITNGVLWNYFYTRDGKTFYSRQAVIFTYPAENSMRVTYGDYGKPWTYVDVWEEFRLEDDKIVWETCRRFPGMKTDPPCAK